jgi:hypothetical protein
MSSSPVIFCISFSPTFELKSQSSFNSDLRSRLMNLYTLIFSMDRAGIVVFNLEHEVFSLNDTSFKQSMSCFTCPRLYSLFSKLIHCLANIKFLLCSTHFDPSLPIGNYYFASSALSLYMILFHTLARWY